MSDRLARLLELGVLTPLDVHFAKGMARLAPMNDDVLLGAALASRAVQRGHVCADLERLERGPLLNADDVPVPEAELPTLGRLREALATSRLVGDGTTPTPLVLDGGRRLYLYRYFQYQTLLAKQLLARAEMIADLDNEQTRKGLDRFFQRPVRGRAPDRQRLAAAVALSRKLCVISGGPGTGKTSVVVKIIALLQEQAASEGTRPLSILLLAPTGKAAVRLGEAVADNVGRLALDAKILAGIPRSASTLHRALGYQPRTPTRFRHDENHPLSSDVVLVDEASMVDLALMAKLVSAVAPSARLVLLGDKDQLASVEAGAILGDICGTNPDPAFSKPFAARLEKLVGERVATTGEDRAHGIRDSIVHLTKSYRYGDDSGIGALARAINAGDAERAIRVLSGEREGTAQRTLAVDVTLVELDSPESLERVLGPAIDEGYGPYLATENSSERLKRFGRFRILCPHRRGPFGVEAVNALAIARLSRGGALVPLAEWYDGRPVLVTRNDYQLELFNGDIGVIARKGEQLAAFFPGKRAAPRSFLPARLPPHETVFAMTVHKSQGLEFDRVALVIPEQTSALLTRELLYTAISRARQRVEIYGTAAALREAIGRRVERASGLSEMLEG